MIKLLAFRKCKIHAGCNVRCKHGCRVLSQGVTNRGGCHVPRMKQAWELPLSVWWAFKKGKFAVCFWGRSRDLISWNAHRVALKGWWDFNKRKKCIFIELLISTRHHGKDLACYRNGSQVGLEVGEVMPEKLASASLILIIITWEWGGVVVHQLSACGGQEGWYMHS